MENEKSKFEELLDNYIVNDGNDEGNPNYNCTFGDQIEDNDLANKNAFSGNSNPANVETFNLIVNEKNQLIEELKSFANTLREKYEAESSKKETEVKLLNRVHKNNIL